MRRKWSKEKIIDEILKLEKRGSKLNLNYIKSTNRPLYAASVSYFGGWKVATEAAGLDYEKIITLKSWSKEKIIEEIKALHKEGEELNAANVRRVNPPLIAAVDSKRYFNSWGDAVKAAGFDYNKIKKLREWTKDKIVSEILKLKESGAPLNPQAVREYYNPLLIAACKKHHFGSWQNAIEAAGLDYDEINKYSDRTQWTKELILREIKKLNSRGENLQYINIKENFHALCSAAVREFENWGNAVEAAGIDYDKFRTRKEPFYWTKEKIVDEILELYEKGEDLSYTNMKDKYNSLVMASVKPRLFNGWRYAVDAAGVNYDEYRMRKPPGYWTKKRIIETIQELHKEGVDLSASNIQANYSVLLASSSDKFGSWRNAIEAAGLDYDEINKYADRERWDTEKIIHRIKELYESGEDLSYSYCRAHNTALISSARIYFGSWENAIQSVGLDYDEIRKDIKTGFYKGKLLERYLEKIFKIIGRKVKIQKRFVFNNETYIPDFVDAQTGEWIEVKLNSWNRGIEESAFKYLKHVDQLIIYYLSGPPRKWYNDRVVFRCIKDFYPKLKEHGREDIIKDLSLIDRGIIPSKYQKELEEFLEKEDNT